MSNKCYLNLVIDNKKFQKQFYSCDFDFRILRLILSVRKTLYVHLDRQQYFPAHNGPEKTINILSKLLFKHQILPAINQKSDTNYLNTRVYRPDKHNKLN